MRDGDTGELVPGLAERWDTSADGRTFTFSLREASWSDGNRITAKDVVRTFERLLSPKLGAEYRVEFFGVAGAQDFANGKSANFADVGIKEIDSRTVRFTLTEPLARFLDLFPEAVILPIEQIQKFGGLDRRGAPWTQPGNLVSGGPFSLKEWKPNRHVIIERSPTYWNKDAVRLSQVVFHPDENPEVAERKFRTGALDISTLPAAKIPAYRSDGSPLLRTSPSPTTRFIAVNVKRGALGDARVRQALALALNREQLTKNVLRDGSIPAHRLIPPNLDGYAPTQSFSEDIATAQRLLNDAGFAGGKGLPTLELIYAERMNPGGLMEVLQQMWRKELGVQVSLVRQEWKVFLDSEKNGQYDLAADSWSATHPQSYYELNTEPGSVLSWYFWRNNAYDELALKASRAMDRTERHRLYRELDSVLAAEMPLLPLFHPMSNWLIKDTVRGYKDNWADHHPLRQLWLQGRGI